MKTILCMTIFLLLPHASYACEQCLGIGGANGLTIQALVLSMASLLAVIGFVGIGVGGFFVHMHRRSKMLESGDVMVNPGDDLRNSQ